MSNKNERACMICGIIKPSREFVSQGCPNCESILSYQNDDEMVQVCTSPSFEGEVALCTSEGSWVAKWLRIDGFTEGIYAVKVNGKLPGDIASDLEAKGVNYRPRDGSVQD